jgi:hypothetical protein
MYCHGPAPSFGLVYEVIMHERGDMDKLNRCGSVQHILKAVGSKLRGKQGHSGPYAFAPRLEHIAAGDIDQDRLRLNQLEHGFVNLLKICENIGRQR